MKRSLDKLCKAIEEAPSWHGNRLMPTPETLHANRREWLKAVGLGSVGLSALAQSGCYLSIEGQPNSETYTTENGAAVGEGGGNDPCSTNFYPPPHDDYYPASRNETYVVDDRAMTDESLALSYNNYYEFSLSKTGVCGLVDGFQTYPWSLEVKGLVDNPRTFTLDELVDAVPLEERVYRFRCVEAWSMVVPWTGFALRHLLDIVSPQSGANFVRFTSANDPEVMPGVNALARYPWPYTEGLRLDEAEHDLAFLTLGLYGKPLLGQNGAPVRMVVPWKYGYKSPKSLVSIELTDEQPTTFWNSIAPQEYGFESNVEPDVPHPRWSQAEERVLGTDETIATLPYNGYEDEVGDLYD